MMMDLDKYQIELRSLTESIEVEGDRFEFNCIGLAEEAGEIMGKLKRALRGEGFDRKAYLSELGDVLGYLALAASTKGIELSDVYDSIEFPGTPKNVEFEFANVKLTAKLLFTTVGNLIDEVKMDDRDRVIWFLSDILLAIFCCALAIQSTLEEVMELNLTKLRDRLERNGTLLGTGDNR